MCSAQFHPRGERLFTSGPGGVHAWPVSEHAGALRLGPAARLPVGGAAGQIGLDREGRVLVGTAAGSGWILDLADPAGKLRRVSHAEAIRAAASPDGKWFATATRNGFGVKLWETQGAKPLVQLIPDEPMATVAFSPDGRWLVTGSHTGFAIWATPQGLDPPSAAASWKLHRQIATDNQVGRCAFTADGQQLALTLSPFVVQLLDAASGRALARLTAPDTDRQFPVCFSPDDSQLVMATVAGAVRVWDLRLIREELRAIGLDWPLPAYAPAPPNGTAPPRRVEVDWGDLKQH